MSYNLYSQSNSTPCESSDRNTLSQSFKPPSVHTKSIQHVLNQTVNPTRLHTFRPLAFQSLVILLLEITLEMRFGFEFVTRRFGGPGCGFGFFHSEALSNRCSRSALNQITPPSSQPSARSARRLIGWQKGGNKDRSVSIKQPHQEIWSASEARR